MSNETQHSLTLNDRNSLTINGISDVDAFNEQEIVAICNGDELFVKGEMLHIDQLSVETGLLCVSGKINSLTYSEKFTSKSVLKRLFGG